MKGRRQLNRTARVAHALEAAVVGRVATPALHAADIELAVGRIESTAMNARAELTGERNDRPLKLTLHFIAQHEKVRAGSKREVQQLTGERPPMVARHHGLAAAGVVQAAWEIRQRQFRSAAVFRPLVAKVWDRARRGGSLGTDGADHRGRRPFTFRAGNGERAVGQKPHAIGVAEAGGDYVGLPAIGGNAHAAPGCPMRCRSGPGRRAPGRR